MSTRSADNLSRKAISAGFILTGFVLMGPALTMVWMFGEGIGATWLEQRVYGSAHVSLHIFGVLSAFAIDRFVIDKSKTFAALATVTAILMGTYNIINMVGFVSKSRWGVAHAAVENSKREMTTYKENRAYLEGRIKWLDGQSLVHDSPVKARKDYKAEKAEAQRKLDALQPPKADVAVDGPAALPSRFIPDTEAEDVSDLLAIPFGVLLYIGEVLSFIFGARIWPRKPEDEVAGQEGMATGAKIVALPKPKDRAPTVPEVVPADLPTGLMVPAAILPADVPGEEVMPVDMPSKLRNAHPAEHIGLVFAALRSLGLTHMVPSQAIRSMYPSLMVQAGIQPMATNTFCRHLAKACERSRPRVGEIEGAASKTRAKVIVYTLPCDYTVEVGRKPPSPGAVKTARAHSRPLSRAQLERAPCPTAEGADNAKAPQARSRAAERRGPVQRDGVLINRRGCEMFLGLGSAQEAGDHRKAYIGLCIQPITLQIPLAGDGQQRVARGVTIAHGRHSHPHP
jgi:hypothetical protein